jgi:hypothetical protein
MEAQTVTINAVTVPYTTETLFQVELGRGERGSYKVQATFLGAPHRAVTYYNGINIGRGYKKRLTVVRTDGKKSVIARQFSYEGTAQCKVQL